MQNSSPSEFVTYIFGDPIPAAEIIEGDPVTAWNLWEESVKQFDALLAARRLPVGPGALVRQG